MKEVGQLEASVCLCGDPRVVTILYLVQIQCRLLLLLLLLLLRTNAASKQDVFIL